MESEGLTLGRADVCPRCGVCKGCYEDIRRELGLHEDIGKSAYARGVRSGALFIAALFTAALFLVWAIGSIDF